MKPLFLRTFRNHRISLLVFSLSGIALLWMYAALFPSLKDQMANYDQIVKAFPETLLKAFGIEQLVFTSYEGFISVENMSFVWPLLAIFMASSFAGRAIAGEIERRTMGLVLAQPISRLKVYGTKYLVGLISMAGFTLTTVLAAIPIAQMYDISVQADRFWLLSGICLLFSLAVLSLAMMFSSFFSERSKVYFATSGLLIAMYVIKIVASLRTNLNWLQNYSFFYYFDPSRALLKGQVSGRALAVFGVTTVVAAVIGAIWFSRRDIPV